MASGNTELLVVTHIEDDGCTFSAQKHTPTSDADLEDITARLQKHALSASKKMDLPKVNHANSLKGKIFAAQYLDDTWYRCRLLFPTGNGKCLVQYIDYGNCEELMMSKLMEIPLDIGDSVVPAMAKRYHLNGIKIKVDNLDKAVQYIESTCTGSYMKAQVLMGDVTQSSNPRSVILFDEKGNSIADNLIDLGYAIEEMETEAKTDVVLSSPPVPQAQLFKNPLLSSPKPATMSSIGDILNVSMSSIDSNSPLQHLSPGTIVARSDNLKRISGHQSPVECDRCEMNKETAERMRLHVIRLRSELKESENRAADLKKSEEFWKGKHDELKQIHAGAHFQSTQNESSNIEMSDAVCVSSKAAVADMISGCASGSTLQKPLQSMTPSVKTSIEISKQKNIGRHDDNLYSLSHKSVGNCNTVNGTIGIDKTPSLTENVGNLRLHKSNFKGEENVEGKQCEVDGSVISNETMSGFMKKIIMPAFGYFKTITLSNNMIERCGTFEKEMNEVVAKIKMHVDKDQDCKEANRLGFTTRRHTLVANLKQSLQHAVKELAKDVDEIENVVAGHTKGLHGIFSNFGDGSQDKSNDGLAVSHIEEFMKGVKTKADLSALCKMIMDGLYQQFDKFSLNKNLRSQFQQDLANIAAYEGHERTIKDLSNENRGIRKRKQAIRLLVTEIKNLEEQLEDATSSELTELEMEICAARDKLSEERLKIHEGFEVRWHLMGNLADMVEKFYPELLIEYKELGISEYILEEGIVLKGMEIDHFDISESEGQDHMNAVVYSTEYRGVKISIHKCPIRKVLLHQVLRRVSEYSNIECDSNLLPMGVFASSEIAYVMVTKPHLDSIPIYKVELLNDEAIEIVLKDIATALLALHESGLTHGMISKECVMYAGDAVTPHAFLSVPNFFADQDVSLQTLANDIKQYGMLAKSLVTEDCPPKLENIISTCAKDFNAITMRNVLDLF